MSKDTSKDEKSSGISGKKAAIAAGAAIGSAAIAAGLLYANSRRKKAKEEAKPIHTPTGEPPETD